MWASNTIKQLLIAALLMLIALPMRSQMYTSTAYGIPEGFTNLFVNGITQDESGYLWVGTGEGLLKFNGVSFEPFYADENIAENYFSAVFQDGEQTWYGHQNGGLTQRKGNEFINFSNKRIPRGTINQFRKSPKGELWFSVQGRGLVKIMNDKFVAFEEEFKDFLIKDFAFIDNNNLLLATNEGLKHYTINEYGFLVPNKENKWFVGREVNCITIDGFSLYVGTASGLFLVGLNQFPNLNFVPMNKEALKDANVRHIFMDKQKHLWVSTWGHGLIKLLYSNETFNRYSEFYNLFQNGTIPASHLNLVYQDREGILWAGSHGSGLYKLNDKILEFKNVIDFTKNSNVFSIHSDKTTSWYGSRGSILVHQRSHDSFDLIDSKFDLPDDDISALALDKNKKLWIGTDNNGLYTLEKGATKIKKVFLGEDNLINSIQTLTIADQFVWIGTRFGLYRLNTITSDIQIFSINNKLRHNDIKFVYKDSTSNDLWVAVPGNAVTKLVGNDAFDIELPASGESTVITGIQLNKNSDLWLSTYGTGIWYYNNRSFVNYSRPDGLLSDYCYGLWVSPEGIVWVTHRNGISRIKPETGQIRTFSNTEGFVGACNQRAIYPEGVNIISFGTDKGLMRFYKGREVENTTPPKIDLLDIVVTMDNEDVSYKGENAIMLGSGAYRVRFDFIGLTFNNIEGLKYKYLLKGYDLDTVFSSVPFAQYNRLEEGDYEFIVIACNGDGYCSETSVPVNVSIAAPFWKKTWFLASISFGLITLIILVIRIREQQQKRAKAILQRELNIRTKEVVEQRDELERKNKDITDSISYAKRIQSAIMPVEKKLTNILPDSFIYFRPRDIVSGDFYWIEKYGDKLLIACADCTGHGVPGAFMSIIGSTVLQDTLARQEIMSPSEVLTRLDAEIKHLLSAESLDGQPRDGMDISVVEIDLKTRVVRISSAMRPMVILKSNGEILQIKGSRFPIGHGYGDKEFGLQSLELQKDDIIYLFTDGYADQFGGPENKKFKVSRLNEIFEFMHGKPADFQVNMLETTLKKWMGSEPQVDDILIMGIRIG